MAAIAADPRSGSADLMQAQWLRLLAQLDEQLRQLAAHPARSVVLLPYAQLMPLAARLWAEQFPDAWAPRFESTGNWTATVSAFEPGPTDLQFDHGRDLLTAAFLLEGAGLGERRDQLAPALVLQATQLGQIAASLSPDERSRWAAQARAALPPAADGPLALEGQLAHTALAWAEHSNYATEALFSARVGRSLDALVIVQGLQHDLLAESLATHYADKLIRLAAPVVQSPGQLALHSCPDAEGEAERAAACVLRQLEAGRTPVALVANDRQLTRRVSALLAVRGVPLRDETGWKLSTTHAAAQLMALLRAAAPHAGTDAVLDALKLAPAFSAEAVCTLERGLRQRAIRHWPQAEAWLATQDGAEPFNALIDARAALAAARPLHAWLTATRAALQAFGLWAPLQQDAAGLGVIDVLGLADHAQHALRDWPPAQRRMGQAAFTRWVCDTLEAASFRPPRPEDAAVLILPLSQLLGRPLAALVLPGADELHLPAAPEPTGPWSAAQRLALRLPTRDDLQAAQREAWLVALSVPHTDVLWRTGDDSGEALLPSPLVQPLLGPEAVVGVSQPSATPDPRVPRPLQPAPVAIPEPSGALLPLGQALTASAYEALRTCPYRFFAQRLLGRQEEGELDVDLDKRDFGIWLHDVLEHFHLALAPDPAADRAALMDAAFDAATQAQALDEAEFLPFAAGWPALRDGYLEWLKKHEEAGARFEAAEQNALAELDDETLPAPLALKGRFDRVDRLPGGGQVLIDYKTERPEKTAQRVKPGSGDTQLPFYALLAGESAADAAYVNVSERDGTASFSTGHLPQLAAQLRAGIVHDMARITAGAPLRPLGEGAVCDWCEARGLCRKDFWSE